MISPFLRLLYFALVNSRLEYDGLICCRNTHGFLIKRLRTVEDIHMDNMVSLKKAEKGKFPLFKDLKIYPIRDFVVVTLLR